jgi:phage shock protein A
MGGGLERKKRMVALLEQQAQKALEKGENDKADEIYRKLLILEPQNQAYRSHLPDIALPMLSPIS